MSVAEQQELQEVFEQACAVSEDLVIAETGLVPQRSARDSPGVFMVVDRQQWSRKNVAAFRGVLDGILEDRGDGGDGGVAEGDEGGGGEEGEDRGHREVKTSGARTSGERSSEGKAISQAMSSKFARPARWMAGGELGLMVGWLAKRVLGQYDLFDGEGSIYFVAPNILSLQAKNRFDQYPFALWIALHEMTHRCQFEGVPWMKPYLLSIIDDLSSLLAKPDPEVIQTVVKRAASRMASGRRIVEEGGVAALIATEDQLGALRRLQAVMSLLEGHAEAVMNDAAHGIEKEAASYSRTLKARRNSAGALTRFLQEIFGIRAKLLQYEEGARFVREVQQEGGRELLARVWESPETLPSLDELRNAQQWVERLRAPAQLGVAHRGGSNGAG